MTEYILRESNSALIIFLSLFSVGSTLKGENLLLDPLLERFVVQESK